MFICNFKINTKKIWKTTLVILIILMFILMFWVTSKILGNSKNDVNSSFSENELVEIKTEEYTNFLKDCHENIDSYIGKNVKIIGYVYRLPDFTSNEFVIARTMIIDDNNQALVVGILAECTEISKYESGAWIEVTGTIQKGNYNGEIPVVEASSIKSVKAPTSEFVYLPTN